MMWFKYNFPMKKIWLNNALSDLGDVMIVFDSCVNEYILAWFKKLIRTSGSFFIIGILSTTRHFRLKRSGELGYEVWGFDPADASKYQYRLNPQFFCHNWYNSLDPADVPEVDIGFVGRDKNGRMQLVQKVLSELNKIDNCTSSIYITAPKWYLYFLTGTIKES